MSEKKIVTKIKDNWNNLFPDLKFFKTEWSPSKGWRPDITAINQENQTVFIEVKFNKNDRDLIYELEKALYHINKANRNDLVYVISDNYKDPIINSYLKRNNIKSFYYDKSKCDFELELIDFDLMGALKVKTY